MLLVAACVSGCAGSPAPAPVPTTRPSPRTDHVDPADIRRLRGAFPPGFDVTDVTQPASPPRLWGLGPGWTADPPQCASLADPAPDATQHGLSASGPGGIVYAIVATPPMPVMLDADIRARCAQWSMHSGRAFATVDLTDAPAIDGAATLGESTATHTVVEGGNQTESRSVTMTAYLGDHLTFVTVVTDPGSPQPQLPPAFAAAFLVQAVATLRG